MFFILMLNVNICIEATLILSFIIGSNHNLLSCGNVYFNTYILIFF